MRGIRQNFDFAITPDRLINFAVQPHVFHILDPRKPMRASFFQFEDYLTLLWVGAVYQGVLKIPPIFFSKILK